MSALDSRPAPLTDGWADRLTGLVAADDRPGTPADKQARALARDPYLWAHPEHTARHLAHQARHRGACANDSDRAQPCDCPPAPGLLAALWAGKARMAAARAAAGVPLNDLDRQALDRGADT
jgi:hypothetical protein